MREIMGWIIFVLGLIALIMGACAQEGYWVCLLIAVFWYISLHQSGLRRKRRKELIPRPREIAGEPLIVSHYPSHILVKRRNLAKQPMIPKRR